MEQTFRLLEQGLEEFGRVDPTALTPAELEHTIVDLRVLLDDLEAVQAILRVQLENVA